MNVGTDRNPVYGTYSRGWEEDGEYGDGDVVEITDNNPVYNTVTTTQCMATSSTPGAQGICKLIV